MSIQHSPEEQGRVVASRMGDRRQLDRRIQAVTVEVDRRSGENRRDGLDRRLGFLPRQ